MVTDNNWVDAQGSSHPEVADALEYLFHRGLLSPEFVHRDIRFRVKIEHFHSRDASPFGDGNVNSFNIFVTNLGNGKSLYFRKLSIKMIRDRGFYEGSRIMAPEERHLYRVDPESVFEAVPYLWKLRIGFP